MFGVTYQSFKVRALAVEIVGLILVLCEPVVTAGRYERNEVGLTSFMYIPRFQISSKFFRHFAHPKQHNFDH